MEIIAEQVRERVATPKQSIAREAFARILTHLRAFTPQNYLAFFFVFMIFFVGAKTIPATLTNTANILKAPNTDELKKQVTAFNNAYSGMLEFKGGPLLHKGAYINVNGWMARAMGQRRMNGVVKLANGQLTTLVGKTSEDIMKKAVASVVAVHRMQVTRGKYYVFVITTQKLDRANSGLPSGEVDYRNANLDELKRRLIQNSVPVLDLRDELEKDGLDFDALFYPTDHHWTAETGFWAYTKIVEFLEVRGVMPKVASKYTDIKNFVFESYRNINLGTQGDRVGSTFGGVDDFTLIYPKFATEIDKIDINTKDVTQHGDFKSTFYNLANLKFDYFGINPHDHVQVDAQAEWRNPSAPLDVKVMSVGNSFNNASMKYFSLIVKERSRTNAGNKEFVDYYNEFLPDVLVQINSAFDSNFQISQFMNVN